MANSAVAQLMARVVGTLPSGEVRPGQLEMAEAVARALEGGETLAVAAGTGTGKSLAYLVPAVASHKRVVVATATKALQDQLSGKDLPIVASGLRRPVKWAVLKGRSNYLCVQAMRELERLGEQQRIDTGLDGAGDAAQEAPAGQGGSSRTRAASKARSVGDEVRRLVSWAGETRSGDRAELDFEPSLAAWSSVSVTADECPGARRCPSGGECFAEAARARAGAADVVVVNLHLLGADVRCGGELLPEHDALVVDEAHELEDVLADCLGAEVSPGRVRALASSARAALSAAGRRTQRRDESTESRSVDAVMAAAGAFEDLVLGDERRLPAGLGDKLGAQVELLVERLDRLGAQLRRASETAAGARSDAAQRCTRSLLALERCRDDLVGCLKAGGDEVVWLSGGARPALCSAPLDVSPMMSAQVFSQLPVVLTSATLPRGLAARLGADPDRTRELEVASPFAYREQALVYCATSLPDPRRKGAESAVHDEIEALVRAAGGRTLALFTSRRAMTAAAEALSARLEWPVLVQGELPKALLLEALSAQRAGCLFATMSFWQGVDVPGPALSLVIIDRIPFPRPDDPLFAARREAAGAAGFARVDLPRAATLLAQGAGRLIRSATDRGVVAVLDPRLATAAYGPVLVRALPPMRRTRERAVAEGFLRSLHDGPGAAAPAPEPPAAGTHDRAVPSPG